LGIPLNYIKKCQEHGNRIDDSFYGVTSNTRNTIKENDVWTYFTDRNGLGDIIQKSNETEAHLFEYRGDKRLSKYTHIQNNIETNNTTYYWDALGRRVAKEIQTPTQTFTNVFAHEGDQDKILLSRNGNGDEYLNIDGQGIDEHLAQITPTEVKPYVTNHLGTVLNSEATDSVKATGAFGEVIQSLPVQTTATNPVVYVLAGRQYDTESSTYYNRERQYDPDSANFMSIDGKGLASKDYNLTRYVLNSPLHGVDPFGEDTWLVQELGFHQVLAVDDPDNSGNVIYIDLAPAAGVSAWDLFFSTLLVETVPGQVRIRRGDLLPGSFEIPGTRVEQDSTADREIINTAKNFQEQFESQLLEYQTVGVGDSGLNCFEFAQGLR
jgi:RHS repeat-associated protein